MTTPSLPERDTTRPAERQGLFRKFDVRRTDGSDTPGGKHDGCEYFVLDVTHDAHAKAALAAYASAVEATHPALASDMRDRYALSALAADRAATAPAADLHQFHERARREIADLTAPIAPVGSLTISAFRGHLESHDFDYFGQLPEGAHLLYTAPDRAANSPCSVCFETEPRTGSCGSSSPKALCNMVHPSVPPVGVGREAEPALWVSPEQLEQHDPQTTGKSNYLPALKRSEGKFTMPLYAAPVSVDSVERLSPPAAALGHGKGEQA